jgi:hypothetical protein
MPISKSLLVITLIFGTVASTVAKIVADDAGTVGTIVSV